MKRRRNPRKRSGGRRPLTVLTLLICLAVGSGFLGVKYVVSPWMERQSEPGATASGGALTDKVAGEQNVESESQNQPDPSEQDETRIVEDKIDTVVTTAYAVQLGSFSTKEAAEHRAKEMIEQGIPASVQERDNAWKVVSEPFATKEDAKAAAIRWREIIGDAFVVGI